MKHNGSALILGLENGTFVCLSEAWYYSEQKYTGETIHSVRFGNAVYSDSAEYTYDGIENLKTSKDVFKDIREYIRKPYLNYSAEELFFQNGIDKILLKLIFESNDMFDDREQQFADEIVDFLRKKQISIASIVKLLFVNYAMCKLANDGESRGCCAPEAWNKITADSDTLAAVKKFHTDEASVIFFKKFIDSPYYSNSIFITITEHAVFTGRKQTHTFLYNTDEMPDFCVGGVVNKFDAIYKQFQSRVK